ncbi:XRE family transcriptional regulator [Corynebacterium aquatimens]|uniref:XRE family transcriptional regulator n=1 Tax=Corynebacterium aquatimens TaxID=1190508 RepID=UPI002540FDA5|nr:XRE family transcriptional regulator [Corynebacterium aquatimens]QYH19583.1 XRE family transcriptional regulator [Corynebacterium aquatimens]
MIGRFADATVVRLAFAPGDALPEHKAARPIIVMGQTGRVNFTAEGETISLQSGTAVHLEADIPHDLCADEESTVTLLILSGT